MVLFYHAGHELDREIKEELDVARTWVGDDLGAVAVLDVKYHPAVCLAYDIHTLPVCILLDEYANVVLREDDPQKLNRLWFHMELTAIIERRAYEIGVRY